MSKKCELVANANLVVDVKMNVEWKFFGHFLCHVVADWGVGAKTRTVQRFRRSHPVRGHFCCDGCCSSEVESTASWLTDDYSTYFARPIRWSEPPSRCPIRWLQLESLQASGHHQNHAGDTSESALLANYSLRLMDLKQISGESLVDLSSRQTSIASRSFQQRAFKSKEVSPCCQATLLAAVRNHP
jgi:hypothetical protein